MARLRRYGACYRQRRPPEGVYYGIKLLFFNRLRKRDVLVDLC
jgi:hypothetical protein